MDKDLQKPVRERPEKKVFGQGLDKRHLGGVDTGQTQLEQTQQLQDGLMSSSSSLQASQITGGTKYHQPSFTQLAGIRTEDPVGVYNPDMEEKMKPKPYLIR